MADEFNVARLTEAGLGRVLDGVVGMTFIIDHKTGRNGDVAAVRDYRYEGTSRPYQLWSLGAGEYQEIER